MDTRLVFTANQWEKINDQLCRSDTEHMINAKASISRNDNRQRILIRDLWTPESEDFVFRRKFGVRLSSSGVASFLEQVADEEIPAGGNLHNHPHPKPRFSDTDDQALATQQQFEDFAAPPKVFFQFVLGTEGRFEARWTHPELDGSEQVDEIEVIGPEGLKRFAPWTRRNGSPVNQEETDEIRHKRTVPLVGQKGLSRIQGTRLGVIGGGGNGASFVSRAKHLFRKFVLVDPDVVEPSNLNRLAGAVSQDAEQETPKVEVLRRELRRFDSDIQVQTCQTSFPSPEAKETLKECDVLVVAPDNNSARYSAATFASKHRIPLVELGAGCRLNENREVDALGVHVRTQLPGGPCLSCLGLDTEEIEPDVVTEAKRERGYIKDSGQTPREIVTTCGIGANLALRTLTAYLGGYLPDVSQYLYFDEVAPQVIDLSSAYERQPDCPICGEGSASMRAWGDHLPSEMKLTAEG